MLLPFLPMVQVKLGGQSARTEEGGRTARVARRIFCLRQAA